MALGSAKAKKKAARGKKPAAKARAPKVAEKTTATKKSAAVTKKTATKKRTTAKRKTAAVAKKAAPKKRTTTKKAAPRKRTTAKKAAPKKRTTAKKAAPRKPAALGGARAPSPAPRASDRLMAACALLPKEERPLDDTERSAMSKVAAKARLLLNGGYGAPEDVVARIALYVDDVRSGAAAPPRDRDELFGLGVLWGEQLRAQVGWLWVHVAYEDGLSSFALVPDDRAFAVFPINRLLDLLGPSGSRSPGTTILERFEAICGDQLPQRRSNAYLVIG